MGANQGGYWEDALASRYLQATNLRILARYLALIILVALFGRGALGQSFILGYFITE